MTGANQIIEREAKIHKGKLVFAYVSASALPLCIWMGNKYIQEDNLYFKIVMAIIGLTCIFSVPVAIGHALSRVVDLVFRIIKAMKM